MANHRNRYVKVILFEPCSTNLQGGTVVGQIDQYLLVERPQPKARDKSATPRKPRATKTNAKPAQGAQGSTAMPAEVQRG
jgi:hypothetical protein